MIDKISDLTPAKNNARQRTPRSQAMLERSLKDYGAGRSILVDEKGNIIAGNGTTEAAERAGITKVRTVETDGNEIIAVVRRGLTEEQKAMMAIADNRTSELAEWNEQVLGSWKPEDLAPFFNADELGRLTQGGYGPEIMNVELKRPPNIVWILVGVPVDSYGDVLPQIEALEARAAIVVKTNRNAKESG
jgi:ParB-like chromosome segregation protein Spo0J